MARDKYKKTAYLGMSLFKFLGEDQAKRELLEIALTTCRLDGGSDIKHISTMLFYPVADPGIVKIECILDAEREHPTCKNE